MRVPVAPILCECKFSISCTDVKNLSKKTCVPGNRVTQSPNIDDSSILLSSVTKTDDENVPFP